MAMIEPADLLNVGSKLRAINGEIKTALQEMAGKKVPVEVAVALHELQREYDKARELYTTVYRSVHGEVPTGLGVIALFGAPLAAWMSLVVMLAAGGLLYRLVGTLREVLRGWRERQAGELQAEKLATLQENIRQAEASGDTAGVEFYRGQLATVLRQPITIEPDAAISPTLLYLAAGALVLVLVMKR